MSLYVIKYRTLAELNYQYPGSPQFDLTQLGVVQAEIYFSRLCGELGIRLHSRLHTENLLRPK